jgi:hydroxyacylglutathione hydrolase
LRLTRDIVLVGGGPVMGFGVSPDADAHCYLLDGGDELALVDCGTGSLESVPRVLANIAGAGCDTARVQHLFLTHYHADHAAGAALYRERLGLAVATGAETAAVVESADHDATSFRVAQELGFFPPELGYPACAVADHLADGDERRVGRLALRYLSTPGHCAGHGSYLVTGGERTYLLAGDAVFSGGHLMLQATWDCDLQASLETIRCLSRLEFDALLPGHGPISLCGGQAHVEAALARIDALEVPSNLG